MLSQIDIAMGGPLGNANLNTRTLKVGWLGSPSDKQTRTRLQIGGVRLLSLLLTPPLPDCCYLGGHASVGSNIGVSQCMSPLSFTSRESNPKQEASYYTQASRHARSQRDAVTYGGKCVAQRGAQFANHAREMSEAVTGSCRSFLDASSLPPLISQQNGRDGLTGVFSDSLGDCYGCTVCVHNVSSSTGAVMQLRNTYQSRQKAAAGDMKGREERGRGGEHNTRVHFWLAS